MPKTTHCINVKSFPLISNRTTSDGTTLVKRSTCGHFGVFIICVLTDGGGLRSEEKGEGWAVEETDPSRRLECRQRVKSTL